MTTPKKSLTEAIRKAKVQEIYVESLKSSAMTSEGLRIYERELYKWMGMVQILRIFDK